MQNPEAFYDTLTIIRELGPSLNGVSRLEVQRIAYLSCLLALLKGRPLAEWGYRFARTEFGTPFSAGINDALEFLLSSGGLIINDGGRFQLGEHSRRLSEGLRKLSTLTERDRFLHAACGSALAVPPSTFSEGVDNEPTVQSALLRSAGGGLLEGPALQLLYQHFHDLSRTVDVERSDLLTPSVVWLSYIADQPVSKREGRELNDA
jgi:hypothetical protein